MQWAESSNKRWVAQVLTAKPTKQSTRKQHNNQHVQLDRCMGTSACLSDRLNFLMSDCSNDRSNDRLSGCSKCCFFFLLFAFSQYFTFWQDEKLSPLRKSWLSQNNNYFILRYLTIPVICDPSKGNTVTLTKNKF